MTATERAQCMDALTIANHVRTANARLRQEIAALPYHDGAARVAALLAEPTGPVQAFPIGRLLTSICRVGEEGMNRLLRHAGIFSTTKRVGNLTLRQRKALAEALEDRHVIYTHTKLL